MSLQVSNVNIYFKVREIISKCLVWVIVFGVMLHFHMLFAAEVYRVSLRWLPAPGASRYRVQICGDLACHSILKEGETRHPEWTWELKNESGVYLNHVFYRVASVDDEGTVGNFSEPEFISLIQPSTGFKEAGASEDFFLKGDAAIQLGVGNYHQTSEEPNLKQVALSSPYFQQKVRVRAFHILEKNREREFPKWSNELEFQYAPFHKVTEPRPFDQPDISSFLLRFDSLRWFEFSPRWLWAPGLNLQHGFRWAKSGSEAVQPQGSFYGGVNVGLKWIGGLKRKGIFSRSFDFLLRIPISGAFLEGPVGLQVSLSNEWNLLSLRKVDFGFRIEVEGGVTRWSTPLNTTLLSWAIWFAPTGSIRF